MGSGNKRKQNDMVRINLPQTTLSGGGTGGGSSQSRTDINKVCPPAFEVKINPTKKIPNETLVVVEGRDLKVLGDIVGRLSAAQLKTLTECAGKHIRYIGRIINRDDGKVYAIFKQLFS